MPSTTFDRVVELINSAAVTSQDKQKITNLNQVKELIVHKEKDLLDNFLEEMLQFQNDKSPKVRETVVSFIEEACKVDTSVLPKAAERLSLLMEDSSTVVVKRVISCMMAVYRVALTWAARSKGANKLALQTFIIINDLKEKALKMQHAPNDGLRMLTLKLMEVVIILQSRRHPESYIPVIRENDISLDQIPDNMHRPLKAKKMEEEALKLIDEFMKFLGREDVTCVNLQTIMGSLTAIGKQRPQFMSKVVQGFETIHVNLPPNLAPTQVNSVRKSLKSNLLQILRHPASFDYQAQITTLLTDLGATQSEVFKAMPKIDEMTRKRKLAEAVAVSSEKKFRAADRSVVAGGGSGTPADVDLFDDMAGGTTPFITLDDMAGVGASSAYRGASDIDRTAADLIPKLNPANVTDLVLLSMVMLPEEMPPAFLNTYTPIAAAGTEAQIKHLSRLLAAQLVAAGLGLGADAGTLSSAIEEGDASPLPDETPLRPKLGAGGVGEALTDLTTPMHISTVISTSIDAAGEEDALRRPALLPSQLLPMLGGKMRQFKPFSLAAVTQAMDSKETRDMANVAFERIIDANLHQMALNPQVLRARVRLLSSLPCIFGGDLYNILVDFILGDVRTRFEMAVALVYQEYIKLKEFQTMHRTGLEAGTAGEYDRILIALLHRFMLTDGVKEVYFSRLFLEAPLLTDNAFALLGAFCQQERSGDADYGFQILRTLILSRPVHRERSLSMLLHLATHEILEVRAHAMTHAQDLYQLHKYKECIEKFALESLEKLKLPQPPAEPPHHVIMQWTEETCRCLLHLFLSLLSVNHCLIMTLADVYVVAVPVVKRAILRQVGATVKDIGQHAPELLEFIEKFPKGSETLVIRVLHVVTDKTPPSPELVKKVKELYQRRVSDVRFLIPVLTGLSKTEVITYLPALIQLDDKLVKEVFNRLLGVHDLGDGNAISPEELLISLHLMEHERTESGRPVADLKSILKATQFCFAERRVYTQERLSIVLSQLIDEVPLPTLYMRTVMQSLGMYPRLAGYITSLLTRLIKKQVWKNAALWEGFIRCCVKIRPQSYQVLLQLPPNPLESVFQKERELRQHLRHYVENFSAAQRSQISGSIIELLEKEEPPPPSPAPRPPPVTVLPAQAAASKQPPSLMDIVTTGPNSLMQDLASVQALNANRERLEEDKRRQLRHRLEQDRQKLSFITPGAAPVAPDADGPTENPAGDRPTEKANNDQPTEKVTDQPTEEVNDLPAEEVNEERMGEPAEEAPAPKETEATAAACENSKTDELPASDENVVGEPEEA